ncbi:MAG: acyl-CoA reductase [Bacteroidota bacterium]
MPFNLAERIDLLVETGQRIKADAQGREAVIHQAYLHNRWFTKENSQKAMAALTDFFLHREKLEQWLSAYPMTERDTSMVVGMVLAGNIPMVGIHDVLSTFVAGHRAKVKLSDKDKKLIPYILDTMADIAPKARAYFEMVDRLQGFDAVIATGSNNSSRYFDAYFGKYPHIIRKNRNAVAVLTGEESTEELRALGEDVFAYFGLGCRNVSKLYVPKDYDFTPLLEVFHEHKDLALHDKYKNNFDYNFTLYILNKVEHLSNGCILLVNEATLQSRIASLHYDYYDNWTDLEREIGERTEEIQCIIGAKAVGEQPLIPFGKAQQPELWDYADGVDTLDFLLKL